MKSLRAMVLLPPLALFACATSAAGQGARPYDEAVAARRAGDATRAEALLAPWVAAHPEDVDARLQLGFARLALGEYDAAEDDFQMVLAAAPDYADAREGLAQVARARNAGRPDRIGFVLLEGALADLSDGRAAWREVALAGAVPAGAGATIDFRGAYYRRFGLEDVELAAGAGSRIAPDTWIHAGLSATPGADFRPKWGASGSIDRRIAGGPDATLIGVELRYEAFPLQDVVTIAPSLTHYFAQGTISLTAKGTGTVVGGGKLHAGGLARLDYLPAEHLRFHVGAAFGPDTDLGVVTDTTALFGGLEVPLSDRVSLTAGLARDWRDGGLDRTEGRFGIRVGY